MVVPESSINNIMSGLESTGGVTLHNHRRKLKQKFETVAKLGQGTYGKVQLGINKETGQEVAIKTIKKCKIETEADLIRIRREIQIMSSLRHPYIIHIYEVFENRDKMVLVMEYAAGGELYDYLSKQKVLQEAEARRIFRQIAMAVYYCHKHQICHRDLKLENILLDENGNAKIADFGLSNVFDSGRVLSTFCGSPLYASPEIVKGIPYLGPEVDCWSLGVLLYTLVYGAMPFDGSNFKRLVRQISAGEYYEPKTPSTASELIAGLLTVNGTDRLDITGVCKHKWMAEEGKVSCYRLAVELAEEIPNRLDLLLALAPSKTQIKVPEDKPVDKPARSQSLSNIPMHQTFTHIPKVEEKTVTETQSEEPKEKERKRSKTDKKTEEDKDRPKKKTIKTKEKLLETQNSEVSKEDLAALLEQAKQVKVEDIPTVAPEELPKEEPKVEIEKEIVNEKLDEKPKEKKVKKVKEENKIIKKEAEPEIKPERKKSRVLEAAEMFSRSPSQEKAQPKKAKVSPEKIPIETKLEQKMPEFCLASTINVNKLVNELNKEKNDSPVKDDEKIKKENAIKVISHAISESELNEKKSSTLPRRKLSRTTTSEPRIEPERMVANTKVSQIIYPTPPIPPPRPSLLKQESSKERIIPIQIEKRDESEKPAPLSKQASISSRTSSISSIGRQDSDSSTTTCEPIRKSPREVIIPIAVEGGGFVTPSVSTLSKMNSVSESEEDLPLRGFSLHSTRKRSKHGNETTDSLSSDEDDDNFEILTTENLFSTLLSRMRNLTQRLDEGRPTFPRLFNSSIFDSPSHRRLTETKSFNNDDPTPWRNKSTSTSTNSSTLPRVLTSKSLRRLLSKEEFPPAVRRIKRTTSDTVQKNGNDGLERVKKYLDELNSETVGRKEISKHLRPRTVYLPGSSQTSEFEKYVNFKQSLEKDRRFLAMSPSLNSYDRLKELKEFRRSISENNEYEPLKSPSKSILEKYLYNDLDKKVKKDESKVDKAIKSLRKNSQNIENQFSESKLLKRAVSLEEINNPIPRNKRASSLKPGFEQKEGQKIKKGGVFEVIKKIEKPDDERKSESTEDVQSFVSVTDNSDTWSSSDPTERFFDTSNPNDDNVLERIRRKSFYHRFNLPKRNVYRRSSSNMERKRYF